MPRRFRDSSIFRWDHLFAMPVMIGISAGQTRGTLRWFRRMPAARGQARGFAKRLNCPLAIIDKRREEANVAEVMNVVGDVKGATAATGG